MSPAVETSSFLDEEESAAIREGVERAITGAAGDLRAALERDPDSFLRLVALAQVGARHAERLLHDSVNGARRAGHSWDAIGGVLGVSRQAAQQRFKSASVASDKRQRVVTGAHAFNEMRILAEEGRRGHHLVDFGALFLVVERSRHQWEHRRLIGTSRAREKLEAEGWLLVGSWFPFCYYKRPLAAPAV